MFTFSDAATLELLLETAGSMHSPTDQYLSSLTMDGADATEGHCDSSMGSMSLVLNLSDDHRLALALLDGEYNLSHGYTRSADGTEWQDAYAATVLFGSQAWFGDADYYPTNEDAQAAFATFSEDYAASVILGHLDSLGLAGMAAWSMRYVDAVDQIREANAFSDEEWDAIVDAAWEAAE